MSQQRNSQGLKLTTLLSLWCGSLVHLFQRSVFQACTQSKWWAGYLKASTPDFSSTARSSFSFQPKCITMTSPVIQIQVQTSRQTTARSTQRTISGVCTRLIAILDQSHPSTLPHPLEQLDDARTVRHEPLYLVLDAVSAHHLLYDLGE